MILSKSNYLTFLKHPAWLWLEKHDKIKLPEIDEDTQAVFDAGNLFEEYAEQLFPDALKLGYKTENGAFDFGKYKALPDLTIEALTGEHMVLMQGRVEVDGITCIFDVLERTPMGTFNLYEIKSSTKAKPEHEYDLAFQTTVLERAGLTIDRVYVIHVNNEYVRDGEIDPEGITTTTEVTTAVRALMDATALRIEKAKEVLQSDTMPDPSPRHAALGSFGEWLHIYKTLHPDLDQYSIYNLYSPGATRIGTLEDLGITTITDIPDDTNLTAKQHHQVLATKRNERLINHEEIEAFMQMFQYPLYFLDYETFAGVVPPFDGLRPYQQVPFQYSLHVLRAPDAVLEHCEYLHINFSLPVPELVAKLEVDIGGTGSVVVWNQGFEKMCNQTMARIVPEYANFLLGVNDRIVDLMVPFAEGWFVDKDFFGSASIKAVLPVLVPELSYKELNVQGGGTAQRIWMQTILDGKNQTERENILADLRKYCELDTLAMVKIWEVLKTM